MLDEATCLEAWCALIDGTLATCHVEARPLSGLKVRIRHSHRAPFASIGVALAKALEAYGATIVKVEDMASVLANHVSRAQLADIDAFVIVGETVGASAEALELAHSSLGTGVDLRDRLYVAMPKEYEEGFIKKRLAFHAVSVDLYTKDEIISGLTCARAILAIVAKKREIDQLKAAEMKIFAPSIGIVTALPVEFNAVASLLNNVRKDRKRENGVFNEYLHGTLPADDGGNHHVVLAMSGVGNNLAAIMAERLLNKYRLADVFMVGIAGGIPQLVKRQPDIRLGDVVVGGRAGIIQYDRVKQNPGEEEPDYPPRPVSQAWLDLATRILSSTAEMDAFNARLKEATKPAEYRRPAKATDQLWDDTDPKNPVEIRRERRRSLSFGFQGAIGSGNRVVKSHAHREELRTKYKVIAVEMEGSGVADAAHLNARQYFVVRGICDYANTKKNDQWHAYAARAAAVFAIMLIENMPLDAGK